MKRVTKILGLILLIILLLALAGIFYLNQGLKSGTDNEIPILSAKNLGDGQYVGHHEQGRWSNQVTVTVKSGRITEIKLEKDVTFVQPDLSKYIFERVIESQTTDIDIVAGATVTSKAYLQAIAAALK
jgi:uncharacterized protein with FMN-binding domain